MCRFGLAFIAWGPLSRLLFDYLELVLNMKTFLIAMATFLLASFGFILSVVSLLVSPLLTYFPARRDPLEALQHEQPLRRRLFPKQDRNTSVPATVASSSDDSKSVETHSSSERSSKMTLTWAPDVRIFHFLDKPPVESPRAGIEFQTFVSPSSLPFLRRRAQTATEGQVPTIPLRTTGTGNGLRLPQFRRPKMPSSSERAVSAYDPIITCYSNTASPSETSTSSLYAGPSSLTNRSPTPSPKPFHIREKSLSSPRNSGICKAAVSHRAESPPPRTRPYEAPYFFPPPGSHEAVGYVQRAREDLKMGPALVSPNNRAGRSKGCGRSMSYESIVESAPLGQNLVIAEVEGGKSQMEIIAVSKPNGKHDRRSASVDETKKNESTAVADSDRKSKQRLNRFYRRH